MTYTLRTDLTARDGEHVAELDTGDLIAVSCTVERSATGVLLQARARAITADGEPVMDALGNPVETIYQHTVAVERMDADLPRDCMLAVLGEPVVRSPPWSERALAKVSIRVSLAVAPLVGQVDAGAVL